MIKFRFLTLAIFLWFINGAAWCQTSEDLYKQGNDLIDDGNYHAALNIYLKLLKDYPNNANLNFKAGYCYLNTAIDKVKAIPYLEFASKHLSDDYKTNSFNEQNAPIETLFYLGKAYHVNYRFDDAESTFLQLKQMVNADDHKFLKEIDHELAACQVARTLIKNPVEMNVTNLGKNINSIYAEHSPCISGDESILIYTSKRKGNTGGKMTDDGQYFEDIYISSFDGEKYTPGQKISENINTPGHEASIGLSFDGTKLFIYKDDDGDGNIYVSTRKGAEWQVPEKLPEPINSKYRETHASMSLNQDEIFFTSDRKGGYGGLDIYRVRKLPNGKWSRAQNLGPNINTPYDEEGPYLHPDGTSLFFASKGHNTMGGFDIFVSHVLENGSWSIPENLGYPINTPDDDVYYVPSVDGRRAYYASYANNSIGNYDIFRIDLSETHVRNQTVIAGIAMNQTGVLLEDGIITITDGDDNVFGIYTPDPESKKFLFILPRGKKFTALFESSNLPPFEYTLTVPKYSYDQSKTVVVFNDIVQPIEPDSAVTPEPLADKIKADEELMIEDDTLILDTKTLESKSAPSQRKKPAEITPSELLVSNELYKNDKYIEPTAQADNTDTIQNKDSVSEVATTRIDSTSNAVSANLADNDNSAIENGSVPKDISLILGLVFGLAIIGSTVYVVFRRRRD